MLLLRHARAGERLSSPHIDRFRQLDHAGRSDARQLVWTLADYEITQVVTSPLARCVETVVPLAGSRCLVVDRREELLPEASLGATLELLEGLPDETLVCTHREVIERLFHREVTSEEAGVWVLERNHSLLSPVLYVEPQNGVEHDGFPRSLISR